MSTTTVRAPGAPATAAGRRTLSPTKGLVRSVLRLHRTSVWLWAGYVAATAGLLLWLWGPGTSGLHITGRCDAAVVNACTAKGPTADTYHALLTRVDGLIGVVPLIASAVAGGVLVARELERGTAHLAWTQSVTPARWLAVRLAVPAVCVVAGTTLLMVLRRLVASGAQGLSGNRWYDEAQVFDNLGPTAVALPLLGLAIGALIGFLAERTAASIFFSLLVSSLVTGMLDITRDLMWPTVTVTGDVSAGYPRFPGVIVAEGPVTGSGARLADDPGCVDDKACLAAHDIVGYYREGHPPSHFWPLQLAETGVVLALTAIVVFAVFRILGRRVA
ncbi:ABC transporter permease [Streptomyces beihaiensis]|uniref:ABC transporter permease n=1 Tax=Streptomyces beihaiensis TaxID=2984495 RepID=A0ABT3TYN5_9ACTN|nr:ABC transporter permease [Streptomyces beihaiensis]MCX3062168.1 ABC transporter permease [Streptomyces beihaiensis]